MTPKYRIWDTFTFGKNSFMVVYIGPGRHEWFKDILCYHTYDFTMKKLRVFAVKGVDKKKIED